MNRPRATATSNYGWDSLGRAERGCGSGADRGDATAFSQVAPEVRG